MLVNWKILLMKEKKYRQLYSRSSMYFYVSSFQLLEMFKGWIRLKKIICLCSEFGPIFHIWAFGSNSETNGNRKIKVIRQKKCFLHNWMRNLPLIKVCKIGLLQKSVLYILLAVKVFTKLRVKITKKRMKFFLNIRNSSLIFIPNERNDYSTKFFVFILSTFFAKLNEDHLTIFFNIILPPGKKL